MKPLQHILQLALCAVQKPNVKTQNSPVYLPDASQEGFEVCHNPKSQVILTFKDRKAPTEV